MAKIFAWLLGAMLVYGVVCPWLLNSTFLPGYLNSIVGLAFGFAYLVVAVTAIFGVAKKLVDELTKT